MSVDMFKTWGGGGGELGLFLIIEGNQEKNLYKRYNPGWMLELTYKSLNIQVTQKTKKQTYWN